MRFMKMPTVSAKMAEPKSTIYWRIGRGEFVTPIKQGPRAAAFIEAEIDAIAEARAAGASVAQIRELVRELHAARPTVHAATPTPYPEPPAPRPPAPVPARSYRPPRRRSP